MNNRRSLRILKWFFCALVLTTLLSHTAVYLRTAKVNAVYPIGNTLTHTLHSQTFELHSDAAYDIRLDFQLQDSLIAEEVFVLEMETVDKGARLLRFVQSQGESVLKAATLDERIAQDELIAWDIKAQQYLETTQDQVADLEGQIKKAGKTRKVQLTEQKERLERDISYVTQQCIIDGVSRDALTQKAAAAKALLDGVLSLKRAQWILHAPEDAVVLHTGVKAGDSIGGYASLFHLAPLSAPIYLKCEFAAAANVNHLSQDDIVSTVLFGNRFVPAVFSRAAQGVTGLTVYIQPHPETPGMRLDQATGATIRFTGEAAGLLIPESALTNGKVFVLEARSGFFGITEYYARETQVSVLERNGMHASVHLGITEHDRVITESSRPLKNAERVVLMAE